ncbi:MAG: ribonuclease P protein component [Tissierellia bacterium]|nr:ribonuclease P protein component [Tissierellia bacterium]
MNSQYYLKKDQDFTQVYKKRKTYGNRNLTLYIRKNNLPFTRVGFSINKKVGKAVIRNKLKRRLRELFRKHQDIIKTGYDLVFVVKQSSSTISFQELESAFLHILRISKIIKRY